jgi:hypothetical protein
MTWNELEGKEKINASVIEVKNLMGQVRESYANETSMHQISDQVID